MPKDRVTQTHQGYGFVEFLSEEDADYAIKILNMIKLYGKPGNFWSSIRPNSSNLNWLTHPRVTFDGASLTHRPVDP